MKMAQDGAICALTVISRASRRYRRRISGEGVDSKFMLLPDDHELVADGADTTRVVLRVTDEFGAVRTYAERSDGVHAGGPGEADRR